MARKPFLPSFNDRLLWRQVMKDVAVWKDLPELEPPSEPEIQSNHIADPEFIVRPKVRPKYGRGIGIDRNTQEKLQRGKMPIDGKLDLHGFTQTEAFSALNRFVLHHVRRQSRCILIVTGKGRDGVGILRQSVPRWLEEPDLKQFILSVSKARIQHGAEGALYVLLRRAR